MKRVLAFLLASIMVMASCMTVLAAESEAPRTPSNDDRAKITVTNLTLADGGSVKAYKIVEATYSEGTVSYTPALPFTATDIADVNSPTVAEINAIADKISNNEYTGLQMTQLNPVADQTGTYDASVAAGKYIVIASGVQGENVTNSPMLLSASYDAENNLQGTTANAKIPTANDRGTITVTGVKSDAKVFAYKIVQPKYNDSGLVGYELVPAVETFLQTNSLLDSFDFENPPADTISAIAKAIAGGTLSLDSIKMNNSVDPDTTFTASVGAGEYVVIASGATEVIYNPILLSVYYSIGGSDNTITSGTVSAGTDWKIGETTGHVKSSEPTVKKEITSANAGTGSNNHGGDAAVGDRIDYKITATIPSYSAEYKEVKYTLTDTLSEGLTPPEGNAVVVKMAASATDTPSNLPVGVATVSVKPETRTITVDFTSEFILANGGKTIVVTYPAVLNDSAVVNMDDNPNDVTLSYSNDPSDVESHTDKKDKTYVYTFELDGNVNGSETTINRKNHEIIKVNENGEVVSQTFNEETTDETTVENALAGATFTLTNTETSKVYTATTDNNGYFNGFTGLDAGTYTLVETAAPEGYTIDPTEHTVVIAATYNTDGTLNSYSVEIDGTATSTYTATYKADKTIEKIEGTSKTTYIQNTKLQNLPSTGGIGTYIFTVLGVALMVIAAVLYMRKRRQAQ